jgi:hypothetical protein
MFMENLNGSPSKNTDERKEWQKPTLVTLDFFETKQEKNPGGADGDPARPGNLKTS